MATRTASGNPFPMPLNWVSNKRSRHYHHAVFHSACRCGGFGYCFSHHEGRNCGPTPCLVFNEADQYVSVTGQYTYASPAADEIRGPCPGLNAAANHGYLPRSGIVSLEETVAGLGAGTHNSSALNEMADHNSVQHVA